MAETQLTEVLTDLILSDISSDERDVIVQAKTELENKMFFYKVIFDLKLKLGSLAIQGKLSPQTADLYAQLLHDFPGKEWGIPIRKLKK